MKILDQDEPVSIQDVDAQDSGTNAQANKIKDPTVKEALLNEGDQTSGPVYRQTT
jgi:hypothetical protein